ncbi:MAG: nuclease A inhibitor family protein [Ignavibacteriaceae bacterium]|nr:nuclease A inhibitor family protein [Ignavibacteriaceae bacterium]
MNTTSGIYMLMDNELLKNLNDSSKGLLYQTELDYPFEIFIFNDTKRTSINKANMLNLMKGSPEDYIEDFDFDFLFSTPTLDQDWHTDVDKKRVARFRNLVSVIKNSLTEIRVFRKGKIYIDVYITGRAPSGNITVISTKQMQT